MPLGFSQPLSHRRNQEMILHLQTLIRRCTRQIRFRNSLKNKAVARRSFIQASCMRKQAREPALKGCNAVEDLEDSLSISRNLEGSQLSKRQ